MKALAVLRVSTTSQQIEDQKEELYAYIKSMGYDEIEPVEAIGASAIKLDEKYLAMADSIKEKILEGGIDAVAVWEISRLGRNEVILMGFKEFFIENKVQFICKNPSLKLLNDDGSVNGGTELAFSLFATLSKQEMQEKKARFKRAKTAMASRGQFIGGNTRKYGYKVVDGFFVEDEEEGKVVRQVFQLYSTGDYSTYTLSKELADRGVEISDNKICKMIRDRAYLGEETSQSGMHYPPIISNELFEKVEQVRNGNKIEMKRGERLVLGAKLVKCYKCGATCTSNSKHFVCSRHSHRGPCDNGFAIRQDVVNDLLWRTASTIHLQYLIDLSENEKEEYKKTLELLKEKLGVRQEKLRQEKDKKSRAAEMYVEGLIDKKKLSQRLQKIEDDILVHQQEINSLEERIWAIERMLEKEKKSIEEGFDSALDELDLADRFEVIHKHIKSLTAKPVSYGKRDPRTTRPNGVEIVITTILGSTEKFMYFPKYYQGHNLYIWNGKKWCEDAINPSLD